MEKTLSQTLTHEAAACCIACFLVLGQVLGSDGKPPSMFEAMPFYRINRRDVADLLVAAMAKENTRRATLSCAWGRDPKG